VKCPGQGGLAETAADDPANRPYRGKD